MDTFERLSRQRHAAELRQHGRHFDLPALADVELHRQFRHVQLEPQRTAEQPRVRERQHVGECLNTALQRLLEQHLL